MAGLRITCLCQNPLDVRLPVAHQRIPLGAVGHRQVVEDVRILDWATIRSRGFTKPVRSDS